MKKEYKKILTKAVFFIIKCYIAWCLSVIMLKFIENHNLSPSKSFTCGTIYIFFFVLFCMIFDNICNAKNIYLTIKKNKLPIKSRFSKQDYKNWKLTKVDFYPFDFAMKDDFAIEIAKVCFKLNPDDKESRETLEQAIHYSRSTIILNGDGELQRVFFETEKDLENFCQLAFCKKAIINLTKK